MYMSNLAGTYPTYDLTDINHHQQPNFGRLYSLVASIDLLRLIKMTSDRTRRTGPSMAGRSGNSATTYTRPSRTCYDTLLSSAAYSY